MGRIASTWQLATHSAGVLRRNKRLLLFPFVNGFITIGVLLFFLAPLVLYPTGHPLGSEEHWATLADLVFGDADAAPTEEGGGYTPLQWAIMAALYLVSVFVATFLNTALYHQILGALNGRAVSLRAGFAFAFSRLGPIAAWSLFAGLIGLLLRTIEERVPFAGRWVVGLLGVAWSVAAVFAIPVIIRDPRASSPLTVLKHSGRLIARRWGEGLIGYVGFGALGSLIVLGLTIAFGLLAWGAIAVGVEGWLAILGCAAVWLLVVVLTSMVLGMLSQIFKGALYLYAAEGSIPGGFDEATVDAAWKVKKR